MSSGEPKPALTVRFEQGAAHGAYIWIREGTPHQIVLYVTAAEIAHMGRLSDRPIAGAP